MDIDYIGVNGVIVLSGVKFKYYVIIDYNFINNCFDLIENVFKIFFCILFIILCCLDLILRKIKLENIFCDIKVVEFIIEGEIE